MAEALRVLVVHGRHALEQFLLGQPALPVLGDVGAAVGPHREACLSPSPSQHVAIGSHQLLAALPPDGSSLLTMSGVTAGRPVANSSPNERFTKSGAPRMYDTHSPPVRA